MSVSVTVPAPQVAGEALLTKPPDGAVASAITSSAPSEHPVTPGEKRLLQTLVWTLKPLINLRGSIPLPFVTTFLMVALDEGKSVGTYARAIGVHRFAMSRYLRAIGDHARNGGPGLGLVTIEVHPTDPRRRQVFLTARGRAVIGDVFEQMRRTGGRAHREA
jgi:hypothetical protein